MKAFTNKGSSWSGTTDMSMLLSSKINGGVFFYLIHSFFHHEQQAIPLLHVSSEHCLKDLH